MPSQEPMSAEHLAELLHVTLDLVVDHHHPSLAHRQLAERLQAHLGAMGGKDPLAAELTALRDDVAAMKAAREQERDDVVNPKDPRDVRES